MLKYSLKRERREGPAGDGGVAVCACAEVVHGGGVPGGGLLQARDVAEVVDGDEEEVSHLGVLAGGSLRTCTRTEIGRARMTYRQGECSCMRAEEEEKK